MADTPTTNYLTQTPIYRRRHLASKPRFDYSKFKIAPDGDKIVDMIRSNDVSAVIAQTGSGKTLFMPWALANTGAKVRCALPFTVATRSAYCFQQEHSGLKVGFAAAREIKYTDEDNIVYATTGHYTTKIIHIIKKARSNGHPLSMDMFRFLGHVFVVDEVHSGTILITLLIGLLHYLKTKLGDSFNTRIVFTSATMNHLDVSRHFRDYPTYEVELARLPITHIYSSYERDPCNLKDDPTEDIIAIIRKELKEMDAKRDQWHIIVFRPGVQEVENLVQSLERQFGETEIAVIPAYSELSQEELNEIFEDQGLPKVIVGTNIIESSVTIDGVGAIINDGLVKRVYTNDTGGQKLVTTAVSRAEAIQRAGRTARTRPGKAYHLYTQRHSDDVLTQHHPPEIDRVPIHNVVLSCIDARLIPKEILGITTERQSQALDILTHMHMIEPDPTGEALGVVTDAGNFVSHVNLGIYNAYMIYLAIAHYKDRADELVLRSVIALAVMLETYGPPPFYVPRRKRGQTAAEYQIEREVHIERYFSRFMGSNELETLVILYWTMVDEVYELETYSKAGNRSYKDWAMENSMNNKKLKEFRNTLDPVMQSVARHLSEDQLLDDVEGPDVTELAGIARATLEFFKQAYSKNVFILYGGRGKRYTDSRHNIYMHSTKSYCTDHSMAEQVIAAQVMEIQDNPFMPTRRMIGLSVPIPLDRETDGWAAGSI
jgi:HrpA-like RNA helicase